MEGLDSSEMSEYSEELIEENLQGNEAGRVFAQRHILDKINLFLSEYRRNNYSENYISGFLDGINDTTGGYIQLVTDEDEESDGEELTTPE